MVRPGSMRWGFGSALVVVAIATTLAGGVSAAAEWPTYAGGPRRLFFNPAETQITAANVGTLRIKWKCRPAPPSPRLRRSPPIDLPGEGPTQVVFFPSWDHTLYAVRLRDGSEVWRFTVPDYPGASYPARASARRHGDRRRSRASSLRLRETLYALDAATGAELWRFAAGTGCLDARPGLVRLRRRAQPDRVVAGRRRRQGLLRHGRQRLATVGKGGFYARRRARRAPACGSSTSRAARPAGPTRATTSAATTATTARRSSACPPGFLATRAGLRPPTARRTAAATSGRRRPSTPARGLLFTASSNCDTDDDPATPTPPPPMPPYDEAIFALDLDGNAGLALAPARGRQRRPRLRRGAEPVHDRRRRRPECDVVGIGGKDGTYYVHRPRRRERSAAASRWNDADPSQLPYWRTQRRAGRRHRRHHRDAPRSTRRRGRVYFSTAPGNSTSLAPQRPDRARARHGHRRDRLAEHRRARCADASFAPTSAIPGVVFIGGASSGNAPSLRRGDRPRSSDTVRSRSCSPPRRPWSTATCSSAAASASAAGTRSIGRHRLAHPAELTALCVPGTPRLRRGSGRGRFPRRLRRPGSAPSSRRARESADNDIDEDCDGVLAGQKDACLRAAARAGPPGHRRPADRGRSRLPVRQLRQSRRPPTLPATHDTRGDRCRHPASLVQAHGDARGVHVRTPKAKSKYVYHGKIWVDATDSPSPASKPNRRRTLLSGRRKRNATLQKSARLLASARNESVSYIRLGGRATLTIEIHDYRVTDARQPAPAQAVRVNETRKESSAITVPCPCIDRAFSERLQSAPVA